MLNIDLTGKRALVAGWLMTAASALLSPRRWPRLAATICLATWPPVLGIFRSLLERGKLDESLRLADGSKLAFERIWPMDADFDSDADVPSAVREHRRYRDCGDFSIAGLTDRLRADFGESCLDIVVHSLANGPEVKKPLLETSRKGYLAAVERGSFSFASMVQRLGPLVRPGGSFLALSYLASQRVVPGYGGGMASAKAALESDARVLAFEAGASGDCV